MIHWLNQDVWGPMWPNIFAPSVFTLLGIVVSHLKLKLHHEKEIATLKAHLDARRDS